MRAGTVDGELHRPPRARPAGLLVRHLVRATPAPPSGLEMAGLRRGRLVVTGDGGGVAVRLAERLSARGVPAEVAAGPAEIPADAAGVVFLGGLREVDGPDEAIALNREAFAAARAVAARFTRDGGVFVTVQDTGGDFGLGGRQGHRAWLGGLAALARTVAKEWPDAAVKALDCERAGRTPDQLADVIAGELFTGGTVLDVGLRSDGSRTTLVARAEPTPVPVSRWHAGPACLPPRTSPAHPPPAPPEYPPLIGPDSVVVATGGGRGITAAAVRAIAAAHRPRLVLIGRTPLTDEPASLRAAGDETAVRSAIVADRRREGAPMPAPAEIGALARQVIAAREVRRTIEDLTRAGSGVRYLCLDVRDAGALGRALEGVRQDWGPVTGLVHGAGVLADKPVEGKTQEMFDRVFGVKVHGLRSLLDATADDPLSFVCLFSSVAAQFGNVGQSDYAMANEVLFQVAAAQAASHPGRAVTAVGWGPWDAGMVTPELAGHFRGDGVGLVPAVEGGRAVLATLGTAPPGRRLLVAADGDRLLPADGRRRKAALRVSLDGRPELRDHDIGGAPVVPVAVALEWFIAAAKDLDPAQDQIALADLRVFQKLTVEPGQTRRLTLTIDEKRDGTELRILDENDRPCQSARLANVVPSQKYVDWSPPAELRPLKHASPYDSDALFHGPSFRALRTVDGVSADGAAGTVVGARELGWPGLEPGRPGRDGGGSCRCRHLDPAAVDAALQLAVLWAEHMMNGATLPMAVRFVRSSMNGTLAHPARCVVRGRETGPDQARCDVALLEPGGRPSLELLGVTLVRRP
ncbi:SDR family NAD(P)-dependent oxidoreductase [Spirillospora sp. NPDC048911]|uniref:SDR family NAD(P)-dependent oxidoreductase n=1 Tax=Spirillospora sp. NPDC048911 TaxID=3364527 RepID=UPI0037159D22